MNSSVTAQWRMTERAAFTQPYLLSVIIRSNETGVNDIAAVLTLTAGVQSKTISLFRHWSLFVSYLYQISLCLLEIYKDIHFYNNHHHYNNYHTMIYVYAFIM